MISISIHLDWSEQDMFGHINNVSFFKYVQSARVNFWEKTGLWELYTEQNIGSMLAQSCCKFLKPLFYPGELTIHTELASMGTSSYNLRHKLMNSQHELVAEAEDTIVLYDFNKNRKEPIPQTFRMVMSNI